METQAAALPLGPDFAVGSVGPLLRNVPCLAWTIDEDLRITNAIGLHRIWEGMASGPVVGRTVQEVLEISDSDTNDLLLRSLRSAIAGRTPKAIRYAHASRWYEIYMEPQGDSGGCSRGCEVVALDVTARKATEERLARSEAQLRDAQRIAHVGSWEWDVDSDRVQWTDELFNIYGLRKSEFTGTFEGFLSRVPPEDREATNAFLADAFVKAKPFAYDHRIVRPDGALRTLRTLGDVALNERGRVIRMLGACWDVTELTEASQALEHTISVLRGTLESTADGLLVVALDGQVTAHNQRLCELWKITSADIEGKGFHDLLDLVHPQLSNADACMKRVRELEGRPDAESFDRLEFFDGRFCERYSRPQKVGERIVGRVWSYRDVSEREQLLRRSVFLAEASRLLTTLDKRRGLQAVARLALTLLGDSCAIDLMRDGNPHREAESSVGPQRIIRLLVDAVRSGDSAAFKEGDSSFLVIPLKSLGAVAGAITFGRPAAFPASDPEIWLAAELATRIELALENDRLHHQAQEALEAREELLSVAAHELRGPTTSLNLAAQILQRSPAPDVAGRMLTLIPREVRRITTLLDEILNVADIRSGRVELAIEHVDLVEVVREATAQLQDDLQRSGSVLSFEAPPVAAGQWDRSRVLQVVANLVENAIKFGEGKPIIVAISTDAEYATLTVTDHGSGIPADAQSRVFLPFERAVSSRHYGGLGLGLFISRSFVERLGGTVAVESSPGAGTAFTVRLPVARGR
jgi:PAS domain S-box-containing protein